VIDGSLARIMEDLTDFRNALSHAYESLTPAETWRRLGVGLAAMAAFAERMSHQ
jgi:uncharacterized protein YutE (UPF0331/DUF86 family)